MRSSLENFCYSVGNCRKLLNSCSVVTHIGDLFCKSCYVRLSLSTTANHEIKAAPDTPATLALSAQDSLNCYCCGVGSSIGNASLDRKQHYQTGACRLRGGGSEAEGANTCLEEKKYSLANECANLGTINSMTTVCDLPTSPTAVTTWYSRQHSKLRRFKSVTNVFLYFLFIKT